MQSFFKTLPAYSVPKVVRMETGEVINEVFASLRLPLEISLRRDWMKELGSEHVQRPEGQVAQESRSFQSNQPILNPIRERMGQPVVKRNESGHEQSMLNEVDIDFRALLCCRSS